MAATKSFGTLFKIGTAAAGVAIGEILSVTPPEVTVETVDSTNHNQAAIYRTFIATLADFGVESWRAEGRIGIWTRDIDGSEAKIGAIGVRIRRWVTMHGFAVNLSPDLSHFGGIVPCGIAEYGVTSLARLGIDVAPQAWDEALQRRAGEFLAALPNPECAA